MRFLAAAAVFLFFAWAIGGAVDQQFAQADTPPKELRAQKATYGFGMTKYGGKGPEAWRWQLVTERRVLKRQVRRLTRSLTGARRELQRRHEPSSLTAIALASTAYGVDYSMLVRKAGCETGGTFSPFAKNPTSTASGLFQFLTSTWATTPYGRFSIFDPYANALAAGWMHAHNRGNEWVCR